MLAKNGKGLPAGRMRGRARGMGRGPGKGKGGPAKCVCPECGITVPHEPGRPCAQMNCPQCGSAMVRGE